jgi:hypothetical protein
VACESAIAQKVPPIRAKRLVRHAYLARQANDMSDKAMQEMVAGLISDRQPLAYPAAGAALTRCVVRTVILLMRGMIHLPAERVGKRLTFADETSARVYRETVVDQNAIENPCALVVEFRLRAVRGWGHALFRWESLLNTPLFVGFPGFVSKLWLTDDQRGRYRGLYEWAGAERADDYARALWRVLALVCVPGSIHYVVLPGRHRDELLALDRGDEDLMTTEGAWWRPVDAG